MTMLFFKTGLVKPVILIEKVFCLTNNYLSIKAMNINCFKIDNGKIIVYGVAKQPTQ